MTIRADSAADGGSRILSVVIVAASLDRTARTLPLGAARIVSSLRSHPATRGHLSADLLAAQASDDPQKLSERILATEAGAVGFSVYVWNRSLLLAVARRLRELRPGVLLFAGGPETTADPAGVTAQGELDFAVAGEGEDAAALALARVLAGESPGGVEGVVLPGDGESRQRRAVADLDRVSSPYLDGVLSPGECGGALWELARGCPFSCHFCYESKGLKGVRRFPEGLSLEELRAFVRSGAEEIFVLDPTFNANPARAREILALIRREAPGIHFTFEARAEFLDAVTARGFASIPCSVQIGLQSARADVLASVGRAGFDRKEFRRKIALLSSAGAVFGLDLIYGLPGDDLAGFRDSLDFALSLEPNHLDVFRLAVLPGTVLWERADGFGLERERMPPYRTLSTPTFPAGDLEKAEDLARCCGVFYSAGRAVGWFEPVVKPLRKSPSAFLESIAGRAEAFFQRAGGDADRLRQADIEAFQLEVLADAYRAAGMDALLPAARDLVRLHGAWSRALAEGQSSELELSWDPEDLFGPASRNLAAFVRSIPGGRGLWRVRPAGGGPILERRGGAGRR